MATTPFKRPRLVGAILLIPAVFFFAFSYFTVWSHWDNVATGAQEYTVALDWRIDDVTVGGAAFLYGSDPAVFEYAYTNETEDVDLAPVGDVFTLVRAGVLAGFFFALGGFVLYLIPQFNVNFPGLVRRLSVAFVLISILLGLAVPLSFLMLFPGAVAESGAADAEAPSPGESFWGSSVEEPPAGLNATVPRIESTWGAHYAWYSIMISPILTTVGLAIGWTPKPLRGVPPMPQPEPAPEPAPPAAPGAGPRVPRDLTIRCPDCRNAFGVAAGQPVHDVVCPHCGRHG